MEINKEIRDKYVSMRMHLDERVRRIWGATEARASGYGGVTCVSESTGIARSVIYSGLKELNGPDTVPLTRIRKAGGGRKTIIDQYPDFKNDLERLIEPLTRGDPESPLRWTCKGVRELTNEMKKQNYRVERQTVATLLNAMGYSLQSNRKCITDGAKHPDRNAQFEHINEQAKKEMKRGNPVISVDTKKKELVGNYKNNGKTWQKSKNPVKVKDHDFPGPDVPHAHPYGIYDIKRNEGFVNIGTDHDTAQFAAASIRAWWTTTGRKTYKRAKRIQIMADSGGSNSYRVRLWKLELQKFANDTGLTIGVCHFPSGTSKWNKVEHRLFAFISRHWQGEPLINFETIINLICTTTTSKGLKVNCQLDERDYPTKVKVSDEIMASIRLFPDKFHGEWNYSIRPQRKP
jgi:hypothetical protein